MIQTNKNKLENPMNWKTQFSSLLHACQKLPTPPNDRVGSHQAAYKQSSSSRFLTSLSGWERHLDWSTETKAHRLCIEISVWGRRRRLSSALPPSPWWRCLSSASSAPTSWATATSRGSRRTPRWTRAETTWRCPSSATPQVYILSVFIF